jgi:hypothetical protein
MSREDYEHKLDRYEARLEISHAFDALDREQEKRLTGYAFRIMADPYGNLDDVAALAGIVLDEAAPANHDLAQVIAGAMSFPVCGQRGAAYLETLARSAFDDDGTAAPHAAYALAWAFYRGYLIATQARKAGEKKCKAAGMA